MDCFQASQRQRVLAVIDAILETGKELASKKERSNKTWTDAMFTKICRKLLDAQTQCCCSINEKFDAVYPEWLFDLICYQEGKGKKLTNLTLVLECEWSPYSYDIKYDFEKLLIAKCLTKVMITESNKAYDVVKSGIEEFAKGNMCCDGEVYLLANHTKDGMFDLTLFNGKGGELHNSKSIAFESDQYIQACGQIKAALQPFSEPPAQ